MSLEIIEQWAKTKDTPEGSFTLTWREIMLLKEFVEWLDSRSPTLRAAVEPDTTEALVEEIVRRAINLAQYSTVDQDNFRRFLRERLARS